jgi:hypothetical protein
MTTLRLVFLAVLTALGSNCGSIPGLPNLLDNGKADLIPLPAAGFCQDGGRFLVVIRNQEAAKAEESTTRVTFSRGAAVDLATPEVNGGRIVTLDPVTIPAECFAPDCLVTVTVDSQSNVDESNEDNNVVEERCALGSG